jgi:hypothetical protein
MSIKTETVSTDANQVLLKKYEKHDKTIKGFIEVGGINNKSELHFYLSFTGGTTKNKWLDKSGRPFVVTEPMTVAFELPVIARPDGVIGIYYSLDKASGVDVTITLADNV